MQSPVAFLISILAFTASAALSPRAPSTVQVQFANEQSGANANALFPIDGSPVSLGTAYAGTNLSKGGTLFVTSFMFTANSDHTKCEVYKGSTKVASIADPGQTYQKFSAAPVDWQNGFTISCTRSP